MPASSSSICVIVRGWIRRLWARSLESRCGLASWAKAVCLSSISMSETRNLCVAWGRTSFSNVRVSAIKKDGQALPIPLEEDRTARAQTMLEAHAALIKTAPENLPKFKDVIQYLEEELHLSK